MLAKKRLAWAVPVVAGLLLVAVGVPSIVRAQALTITTTSLPNGEQTVAYSETLHATGGATPYTWTIASGALPHGLTLAPSTGVISGTPTGTGTASFTVKVADSSTPTPANAMQALTIMIAAPLGITTTSLPGGQVGMPYLQTLATTSGVPPATWSLSAGSLPAGLTLDPTSGSISGTPTAAGTANFTVRAMDTAGGTASQALSIDVAPTLAITTTSLPAGTVGASYSQVLGATGGTAPYTWSVASGTLPGGLNLDASTGVISGTPTAAGTANFTVKVTDSTTPTPATATQAVSIAVVTTAQAPAFTSAAGTSFTVGQAGSFMVTTSGSPTPSIVESGALPSGVSFTTNANGTATLAGTPAAGSAGTYPLTLTASNGVTPNATQSFTLTVAAAPVSPSSAATTDLDNLAQAVQGVGPGRSLSAKIRAAQHDLASGNTLGACGVLNGFLHEVAAQSGKKISASLAAQLTMDAQQVESLLACPSMPAPQFRERNKETEHAQMSFDRFEMGAPQQYRPLSFDAEQSGRSCKGHTS